MSASRLGLQSIDGPDRRAVQRRTLGVLFVSAIFGRAAMSIGFVVASLVLEQILGSSTWAGASTAAITVGTAFSASSLSSYMSRKGRRPGLTLGYLMATAGGLVALFGGSRLSLIPFLVGLILVGVGQGGTNLARYAAADLAEPTQRGKAISLVVFASTVGAVGGPALAGLAGRVGQSFGLDQLIGPFGFAAVFMAMAGAVIWGGLRPDPLVVSGGLEPDRRNERDEREHGPGAGAGSSGAGSSGAGSSGAGSSDSDRAVSAGRRSSFVDSFRVIMADPRARLALLGLVVSQAVMVTVMAMTPLHMKAHGHSVGLVGWVLSAHTAGMFAFAPLAGWVSDRWGRLPALLGGAVLLIAATAMTALAGEAPAALMFPGLYLLGLGWSFGMVASSALLTESVPSRDQVSAQGAADLITSFVSGAGALSSGLVFSMAGFHILSGMGIVASGLLLVAAFIRSRLQTLAPIAG